MLLFGIKRKPARHRGIAFMITVLTAFVLLSLVSAAMLTANWSTLRSEGVLAGENSIAAGTRGSILARSMIAAAAEIISNDSGSSGINSLSSNTLTINDGDTTLYSKVDVSRTDNKYTITAKVSTENNFPSSKTKTCSEKAVYTKGSGLIWDD